MISLSTPAALPGNRLLEANCGCGVASIDFLDFLTLIGVHLQGFGPDPLLALLDRVVNGVARVRDPE